MRRALWLGVGVWAGIWISTEGAVRLVRAASEAVRRMREERDTARADRDNLRRGLDLYRSFRAPPSPAYWTSREAVEAWEREHGAKWPREGA